MRQLYGGGQQELHDVLQLRDFLCLVDNSTKMLNLNAWRIAMATNPPSDDGHRNDQVKERSQVHNPKNDTWTKRDTKTGRFMDVKKDGTPFKGVRKER